MTLVFLEMNRDELRALHCGLDFAWQATESVPSGKLGKHGLIGG